MTTHLELGERGEKLAVEYLHRQGYKIREKNYRFQKAEIDIIAESDDVLAFIEVKTRHGKSAESPEEKVDWKKEKMMALGAEGYLEETGWSLDIRYDIITVLIDKGSVVITHIKDAFWPIE